MFQKESSFISIRCLSRNKTGIRFAGFDPISRAGHFTRERRQAGQSNGSASYNRGESALFWRKKWSIHCL
ncbi:MAG: hypothetical protein ABSC01_07640 [Verrucomicrobiota bacterium]|jgi:hypothetical protein